jgi:hypothetical protein
MQVENDIKLWTAAAYGDHVAIVTAKNGLQGHRFDLSAAMVAAANGQTETAQLLTKIYPKASKRSDYKWLWYKSTSKDYKGEVILPVSHLVSELARQLVIIESEVP